MAAMRRMHIGRIFVTLGCALMLLGCGGKKTFHVEGSVEGIGTQNLYFFYRDGDGMTEVSATAVDSKFSFDGSSERESVVEVFNNNHNLIGRFVVKNGDNLEVGLSATDAMALTAKGSKVSERLADFLNANKGKSNIDKEIEAYITDNPKDVLSGVLLAYYYDVWNNQETAKRLLATLDAKKIPQPMVADLGQLIEQSARVSKKMPKLHLLSDGDTVRSYSYSRKRPTLYYFDETHMVNGSTEEKFAELKDKKLAMAYIRLTPDTFGWYRNRSKLPEKMTMMIAQEGRVTPSLKPLDLPSFPYVIVVDTLGNQIYRGKDLDEAIQKALPEQNENF